jgi:hypothetical protein
MLEKDTVGAKGDTEGVSGTSDDIVNSSIGFAGDVISLGSMGRYTRRYLSDRIITLW